MYSAEMRTIFTRLHCVIAYLLAFSLIAASFPGSALAASYTFSQSSWAGGVEADNSPNHSSNRTGWTNFSSKDSQVSAGGDLDLTTTTSSTLQNTSDDFDGGTHSQTATSGSGSSGTVQLAVASIGEGDAWTQATASAGWTARSDHTSVVFNSKMWVLGGSSNNDVWHSTDGASWTEATNAADWSARTGHASVVFDSKMWVLGGSKLGEGLNDVWHSTDGVTWTQATASAGWTARSDHAAVVFDGKMWVIGGSDSMGNLNDVWHSTDGVTWTQATTSAGWTARSDHASVVFNGKMWVLGGNSKSDVWHSTDGASWTKATSSAAWTGRSDHTAVVFDSKMWVLGGSGSSGNLNDVWHSSDGEVWTQAASSNDWGARNKHTSLSFASDMWVLGGSGSSGNLNDVWHTVPAYYASGTFTSSVIDTGQESIFTTLDFTTTTSANTSVTLDVRGGTTSTPDGTWTDWQTNISDGGDISALTGSQYVQYRANVSTSDTIETPSLSSLTFNFQYYPSSATLTSSAFNVQSSAALSSISWTATSPEGTSVSFEVRTSPDGSSWNSWTSFTEAASFAAPLSDDTAKNQWFQYRATLSATDTSVAPTLQSVSLVYDKSQGPSKIAAPSPPAPVLKIEGLFSSVAATAASFTWTASTPSSAVFSWGPYPNLSNKETLPSEASHSVALKNLIPETSYAYRITLTAPQTSFSTSVRSFTTSALGEQKVEEQQTEIQGEKEPQAIEEVQEDELLPVPSLDPNATKEEIQALIDVILYNLEVSEKKQTSELKDSSAVKVPSSCLGVSFGRALTTESTGEDVFCLQQFLNQDPDTKVAHSGLGSPGNETNYFGPLTEEAVGKFQLKYGLVADPSDIAYGYVGPSTRAKLNELLESSSKQIPVSCKDVSFNRGLTTESVGEDVRCLQELLNQSSDTQVTSSGAGSQGNETDYFGTLTKQAVGKFQLKHGLIADASDIAYGYVGPSTRAKLNELLE